MGQPKTILFVQQYPDGGTITGLLDLIRGLDPDRYRSVVSFRTASPFLPEFHAAGIETVELEEAPSAAPAVSVEPGTAVTPATGWRVVRREVRRFVRRDLPSARRLRQVIRSRGVDLVYANNDIISNRDAIVAGLLARRPIVVHVRGMHRYRPDFQRTVDRLLARRVDRFVFMSRAIGENYATLGVPARRSTVLDDPFHIADYDVTVPAGLADELGLAATSRVVLHLGRITPWKGQDVFLRAMAQVVARHPDAVALVVGASTSAHGDRFQAALEALVHEAGIGANVVFAGSRRDVPQLIALAEVVVHSSTSAEPFGRVVVEAMAGSRPVIGADDGGVPEIIDDGVTGVLVPPGDHERLAEAIAALLADPTAARAMGERARAAVEVRFTVEAHATAAEALFDDLLRH